MREIIIQRIRRKGLIAIVRGVDESDCRAVAEALLKGGIDCIEVTFDQSSSDGYYNTLSAISAIDREFGDQICIGAGTVLTPEQVRLAAEAGAKYIISPDVNVSVIEETRRLGLVSIPGALTPTEVATAYGAGADFVKLFPVGNLGSGYVKALKAPLGHVPMLAVGGVNEHNIPEFLAAGCLGFGLGSNLVNAQWIRAGAFDKITETAKALCAAVRQQENTNE